MNLYPYQRDCVREIDRFGGRVLLAVDMGLGKTLVALTWLRRNPDALPAVVVCPASVKYFWEREAERVGLRTAVLEGRTPRRGGRIPVTIVNYDILQHRLAELRELRPRTINLDECQYAANHRTKRTKATKALCRGVPHVIAMSGTPLVNRPIELWPTLNILRRAAFPARWTFAQRYCDPKHTPWGWQFRGASHVDELHDLLVSECMIRRRKADVLSELPEKVRQVIPLPLSDPGEYQKAGDDFLKWLREKSPDRAKRAGAAETLVKMGYLLRLAAKLKLRYVVEWVNDFLGQTDEKLVVFAVHRKMIEALKRRCEARSVVVDGSVTGRKRDAAVEQFQADDKTRLLIGNIQAAGVGITLTAASAVAVAELPWRPGDCTQAEDRCHRIGTTRTVFVSYLIGKDTLEEKLCSILQEKQSVLDTVLDGNSSATSFDIFNQLLEKMKNPL